MSQNKPGGRSKWRGRAPWIQLAVGVAIVSGMYWASLVRRPVTPPPEGPAATEGAKVPAEELALPPFHANTQGLTVPKLLSPAQFKDPDVARAYRVAQRIPTVLAQQPCYCWCDSKGHTSLLDCYASDHAST